MSTFELVAAFWCFHLLQCLADVLMPGTFKTDSPAAVVALARGREHVLVALLRPTYGLVVFDDFAAAVAFATEQGAFFPLRDHTAFGACWCVYTD